MDGMDWDAIMEAQRAQAEASHHTQANDDLAHQLMNRPSMPLALMNPSDMSRMVKKSDKEGTASGGLPEIGLKTGLLDDSKQEEEEEDPTVFRGGRWGDE